MSTCAPLGAARLFRNALRKTLMTRCRTTGNGIDVATCTSASFTRFNSSALQNFGCKPLMSMGTKTSSNGGAGGCASP